MTLCIYMLLMFHFLHHSIFTRYRKLSFNLRLDTPSYLDQGVRLEVQRPCGVWEPVRFYTSTANVSYSSLITLNGTHVVDQKNSWFPLYENQSSQPFTITEYLCGNKYYTPGTEYRWLQIFNDSGMQDMETWSLSDVSIVYFEGGLQCSSHTVPYSESSVVDGLTHRSVIIRPQWSNAVCLPREEPGVLITSSMSTMYIN